MSFKLSKSLRVSSTCLVTAALLSNNIGSTDCFRPWRSLPDDAGGSANRVSQPPTPTGIAVAGDADSVADGSTIRIKL